MRLSQTAILEYQELVLKERGESIAYAEAEREAQNFYDLFCLIVKP